MTEPRYPLATLEQHAHLERHQLMAKLGISGSTLARLRHQGLTPDQADRYSTRLGYLPWQIWPTWITDHTGWDPDHPAVQGHVPPVMGPSDAA